MKRHIYKAHTSWGTKRRCEKEQMMTKTGEDTQAMLKTRSTILPTDQKKEIWEKNKRHIWNHRSTNKEELQSLIVAIIYVSLRCVTEENTPVMYSYIRLNGKYHVTQHSQGTR